jgi:hypothetical protein
MRTTMRTKKTRTMRGILRTVERAAIVALALWVGGGCLASEDTAPEEASAASALDHDHDHNPNPALFPINARPFGRSLVGWAEAWWHWSFAIPLSQNPNDTATADPGENQHGPVYFLSNPPIDGRTFDVPRHKVIAVLLSSVLNDFPCPDPTFHPAPGQTLFEFLSLGAAQADNVADLEASLDGVPLTDLTSYHVASHKLMHITGDLSLQVLDACITGSPQPAVIEAYFMMLRPLGRGTHVLTTRITTKAGVDLGLKTRNIHVR